MIKLVPHTHSIDAYVGVDFKIKSKEDGQWHTYPVVSSARVYQGFGGQRMSVAKLEGVRVACKLFAKESQIIDRYVEQGWINIHTESMSVRHHFDEWMITLHDGDEDDS